MGQILDKFWRSPQQSFLLVYCVEDFFKVIRNLALSLFFPAAPVSLTWITVITFSLLQSLPLPTTAARVTLCKLLGQSPAVTSHSKSQSLYNGLQDCTESLHPPLSTPHHSLCSSPTQLSGWDLKPKGILLLWVLLQRLHPRGVLFPQCFRKLCWDPASQRSLSWVPYVTLLCTPDLSQPASVCFPSFHISDHLG
jgi:hypothetical protein